MTATLSYELALNTARSVAGGETTEQAGPWDGRVVDATGLETRRRGSVYVGSNPTPRGLRFAGGARGETVSVESLPEKALSRRHRQQFNSIRKAGDATEDPQGMRPVCMPRLHARSPLSPGAARPTPLRRGGLNSGTTSRHSSPGRANPLAHRGRPETRRPRIFLDFTGGGVEQNP